MKEALLGAAAWAVLGLLAGRAYRPPAPPPSEIHLSHEDAVESAGLLSLGMRRLAADLAFTRLLMYYGSEDERLSDQDLHNGKGDYPELAARTMRILDLDPWFSYAAHYTAAALAFNMDKPNQALEVLRYAAARDPRNWQYRSYMAAIGFRRQGEARKVLLELSPVLRDPECPTMLKHIVAFLNRRLGHREEAIRLYRDVLQSRDKSYHAMARAALRELGAEP